jgi:DNA transformation protein
MKSISPAATTLLDLKNISFGLAEDLRRAGIGTVDALQRAGAIDAWLAIRHAGRHPHSVQSLLALEGALLNVTWMNIPVERRAKLVRFAACVFAGMLNPMASD